MFNPSRDQVRDFLFDLWAKYRAGQALAGAETLALEAVLAHPEYHALLDDPERNRPREFPPEAGESNPFLHLMLHMTVAEQVGLDQPPGVRARYQALLAQTGEPMAAQHGLMECLGEEIWRVQRHAQAFDTALYLGCIDRRLGRG